jgi:hypothetical protein
MNTKEMHNKEILCVWWPDTVNESGIHAVADERKGLKMSATYHGDHDEFWIVEYDKDSGTESRRHNIRYVESFEWK